VNDDWWAEERQIMGELLLADIKHFRSRIDYDRPGEFLDSKLRLALTWLAEREERS